MYLSVIFIPLLGAVISGLFGRYIGKKSGVITSFCVFVSLIFSWVIFYNTVVFGEVVHFTCYSWINVGTFYVDWGFLFDSLTSVMLVVVCTVSFLVHVYSLDYIAEDPHRNRFISYLSFFTFFILMLVTGDNFMQLFLGWEGVGLCSFLLINFWFTRIQANKAAIKAILVNRVGDFFLALGIFFLYTKFGSVEYFSIFAISPVYVSENVIFFNVPVNLLTFATLCLFLGAVGKSAQLGLHTWLPDAIEGPTPVSALIHAATIVTAGVFLLARCSPLFEYAPITLEFICLLGAITALFAATVGLVQNDLKKVIAYSTCSQLGYIVFSCGLSNYSVSMFHLATHAFFKALLFLTAGAVIHAIQDEQDIRRMGGLRKLLPYCYAIMLIGSLALAGFPFLSGFYSKDVLLEIAASKFTVVSYFSFCFGVIGAFLTAFYSIRLLSFTFYRVPKGFLQSYYKVHEAPQKISFSLLILCFGSLFFGYLAKDLFVGIGTFFWQNSLFFYPVESVLVDAEFISVSYKLLPLLFSIFGLFSAYFLYTSSFFSIYKLKMNNGGRFFYNFLNRKWFFDKIQIEFVVQPLIKFSYERTYKTLDRGVFELFGPNGFSQGFSVGINQFFCFNTGYLYHAMFLILVIFLTAISFLVFNFYSGNFVVLNTMCYDARVFIVFLFIMFFFYEGMAEWLTRLIVNQIFIK